MTVIKIKTTRDYVWCDTCGDDWADGGRIYINDKLVDVIVPEAACFGGVSASEDELLTLALAYMGIDVIIDGDRAHISNVELDERRNEVLQRKNK